MAIQLRRGDYADFDPSQLLDGELAAVLENDPDTDDGTGLYVGFGDDNVKRLLTADDEIVMPIATTTSRGAVIPDGTSITVDMDGTIHGAPTVTPSSTAPVMDGTAAAGSSTDYARADHVHPTDTSRASASELNMHTSDTTAHVTAAERSTWNAKASTDTATQSANGLMSSTDKAKLDGIESGANAYELPLMSESTRGGAKVGSGLAVEDGALSVALEAESDGSTAGPIVELTAKGHAEQSTTTGKNLLPNTATSKTVNDVTFTVNADGSVTANGTASAGTSFPIKLAVSLPSDTYTLSSVTNIPSNVFLSIQTDEGSKSIAGNRNSVTFSGAPSGQCWIFISSGVEVNNLTIYPQLELGSTATEYEPYTGGAPSPSPDYPQEIQTVTGHEVTGETGRFVDLVVKQGNTTLSTIPIPLPSRGWAAGLPDGTADTLTLDGAGKVVWSKATNETTQAVTDGVTGTVGVDVLSSTGQIADGATVLYKLATPVTEQCGYVDLPEIPEGATLSIPELDGLNVKYHLSLPTVLAGYEDRIKALEEAIAELATS